MCWNDMSRAFSLSIRPLGLECVLVYFPDPAGYLFPTVTAGHVGQLPVVFEVVRVFRQRVPVGAVRDCLQGVVEEVGLQCVDFLHEEVVASLVTLGAVAVQYFRLGLLGIVGEFGVVQLLLGEPVLEGVSLGLGQVVVVVGAAGFPVDHEIQVLLGGGFVLRPQGLHGVDPGVHPGLFVVLDTGVGPVFEVFRHVFGHGVVSCGLSWVRA